MWPERILGPFQGGFQSLAHVARVKDRNYTSGDLYERCASHKRFVQEYPVLTYLQRKLTAVPTAVPTAACMWCGREFDPGLVDAHEEQCGN